MALKMMRSRLAPALTSRVAYPEKRAEAFYLSPAYKAWATAVKTRDGFKCQDVGPHSGALVADHVEERRDGGAEYDVSNGLTRCMACSNRKTSAARARRLGLELGGRG